AAMKLAEVRSYQIDGQLVRCGQSDPPAGVQIATKRLALDRQNRLLDFFGLLVDRRPAFGQGVAGLLPIKQTSAQFRFECRYAPPYRRSTGSELACRVHEAARARHCKEVSEIVPLHGNSNLKDQRSIIAVCRSKLNR